MTSEAMMGNIKENHMIAILGFYVFMFFNLSFFFVMSRAAYARTSIKPLLTMYLWTWLSMRLWKNT